MLLSGECGRQPAAAAVAAHYIQRALQPYADLIEPGTPPISPPPSLIFWRRTPRSSSWPISAARRRRLHEPLQRWINNGGTLIRFAGPRPAALPTIRWFRVKAAPGRTHARWRFVLAESQPLAEFPPLAPSPAWRPTDVTVKRQVLAEPTPDLAERTWASLADGTPLVTVKLMNAGRIVLFHVSAEATWSDLPISGYLPRCCAASCNCRGLAASPRNLAARRPQMRCRPSGCRLPRARSPPKPAQPRGC